jgi:hypothetical protein
MKKENGANRKSVDECNYSQSTRGTTNIKTLYWLLDQQKNEAKKPFHPTCKIQNTMHLLPTTTRTRTAEWTPQARHRARHLHMDHVLVKEALVLERNVLFRCHGSRQLRNRSDTLLLQLARSPGASATDQLHAVRLHTLCACRHVGNLLILEASASVTRPSLARQTPALRTQAARVFRMKTH